MGAVHRDERPRDSSLQPAGDESAVESFTFSAMLPVAGNIAAIAAPTAAAAASNQIGYLGARNRRTLAVVVVVVVVGRSRHSRNHPDIAAGRNWPSSVETVARRRNFEIDLDQIVRLA